MARIERFEDIEAWKLSREITGLIYEVSSSDRFCRDFALVNQIRRALISILSNIAEGFERSGNKEFLQFLSIAKKDHAVRSGHNFMLPLIQKYISDEKFKEISDKLSETSRMLAGFIKYLQQTDMRGSKYKL